MTETTQMQSTNLQHSISSTTYAYVLTACKYRSIIQYWKREKIKYLWDLRILGATEQNQKSKCEHTQHKLFKSKWPKQHKCNQQIYYTQSQVQYIHAGRTGWTVLPFSLISLRTYNCRISIKGTRIKSAWISIKNIHSTSL